MNAGGWRVPGSRTLRRSFRWLRSRFRPRALVLGYHRVADEPHDPFGLCVSPARFEQQLEVLSRRARPLPLGELLRSARDGHPPRSGVAVTFDDGYADLLAVADPLLRRYAVPATCFVVTGALGREFWWDTLARAVREGVRQARPLRLALGSGEIRWFPPGERDGNGTAEPGPPLRAGLYRALRGLDESRRRSALCALTDWAGIGEDHRPLQRALSVDELRRMARDGPWRFEAHTQSHADLVAMEPAAREAEIEGSRRRLQELLDGPVEGFAYPFGSTSHAVSEAVRAAGFRWACASENDVVRARSNFYAVPRFWPGDWGGERFGRWLSRWL